MLGDVIDKGRGVCAEYWDGFRKVSPSEVQRIEGALSISLPPDFKEFYTGVGCGQFPAHYGGGIDSPGDIIGNCSSAIFYITGSLAPGEEWASQEDHRKLWVSNGRFNPDPSRFTAEKLSLDGIMLWDLLGVGTDGSCGYQYIYVGDEPRDNNYLLLFEHEIEFAAPSFMLGMLRFIEFHGQMDDA